MDLYVPIYIIYIYIFEIIHFIETKRVRNDDGLFLAENSQEKVNYAY